MCLLLVLTSSLLPKARALTPADQVEIQQFKLTDDFLRKYAAAMAEKRAHPDDTDDTKEAVNMMSSLDAMTAAVNKKPDAVAFLRRNGMSAREMVVGGIVILRAQMADSMLADPKMAKYVEASKMPSVANMAFYHAHKAEIAKIMEREE